MIKKYGLKNKHELWRAESAIGRIRKQAKKLINLPEEQEKFLSRLKKLGLKTEKIDDVLALKKEDWLERRLQTIVYKKGIAHTPKEARQLVTHKHIIISNKIVDVPSYIVLVEEEKNIKKIEKERRKEPKEGTEEKTE